MPCFAPKLTGHDEFLRFPNYIYPPEAGGLGVQDLNAGRIPPDTFIYSGPTHFGRGPHGETTFRMGADYYHSFATFVFPDATYNRISAGLPAPRPT